MVKKKWCHMASLGCNDSIRKSHMGLTVANCFNASNKMSVCYFVTLITEVPMLKSADMWCKFGASVMKRDYLISIGIKTWIRNYIVVMCVASSFATLRHVKIYLQFCVIKVDSFNFEDNIDPKKKVLFKKGCCLRYQEIVIINPFCVMHNT